MEVRNEGQCIVFDDGKLQTAFPKGTIMLVSSKNSKAVNVKLMGSRKTVLSFPSTAMGYATAEEAITHISAFA